MRALGCWCSFLFVALVGVASCAGSRRGADAGNGPSASSSATSGGLSPAASSAPGSGTATLAASGKGAGQGQTCEDGNCAAGLTCVSYYGIAGGAGPKFTSCEIKCQQPGTTGAKSGCPAGQNCVTIADGPGTVCRPPSM